MTPEQQAAYIMTQAVEALAEIAGMSAENNQRTLRGESSDLNKHPETEGHSAIQLGMMLLISGHLSSKQEMQRFIEGFN